MVYLTILHTCKHKFFSWFWREKNSNFPESFKSVRWVGEVSKNFFTLKSSLTRYKKNYWKIPYLRNDNMLYSDRSYNWGRPSLPPEKKIFPVKIFHSKVPLFPLQSGFRTNLQTNKQNGSAFVFYCNILLQYIYFLTAYLRSTWHWLAYLLKSKK